MKKKANQNQSKGGNKFLSGLGKELLLVGLYGLQDTTGIDLHHKPGKKKHPWQKKWGEK
jgi:hypothetical protein